MNLPIEQTYGHKEQPGGCQRAVGEGGIGCLGLADANYCI